MLRNILTRQVPGLAGKWVETLLAEMTEKWGVPRSGISTWIIHAGGRDILLSLRERLGLAETDLEWSAEVLRTHGNLSSACVLFVLKKALEEGAPGGTWWICSFGAGFSSHGAFLDVE
jgi:alkylresorcinol/alkylpyrone synthase